MLMISMLAAMFPLANSFAEGTKEVSPTSTQIASLYYSPTNYGSYFNCPVDNRINFVISDHTTENLYFGFRWVTRGSTTLVNNMYYRILNAAGVVVAGPTLCPTAGAGLITTYNRAVAGPNIAGSTPAGYTPIFFDPAANDTYYIELYRSNNGGVSQNVTTSAIAPFFDFTVATTTGVRYAGRVFAKKWGFVAGNPADDYAGATTDDVSPSFYTYTADSTVANVVFDRFNPLAFNVAFNSYGVDPAQTDFEIGRRSVYSANNPNLSGSFNTFLNVPDNVVFPTSATPTPPTGTGNMYGCPGFYYIPYTTYAPGDIKVLLDLNGVPGYQVNTADLYLYAYNVPVGINTITWNGFDGLGNQVATNASINIRLTTLRGRVNMPLYDPEYNLYGFTLNTVLPAPVLNLKMFWDDSFLGVITGQGSNLNNSTGAGIANINTGQVSPGHAWNGNYGATMITTFPAPSIGGTGNATVSNLDDDFGNVRIINTWFWTVEESGGSFSVNIPNCNPNPDINITYVNLPLNSSVSANDDVAVGSTYSTVTAQPGNPGPALPVINPNGSYTFVSSVPGIFVFDVPVCAPGQLSGCPNVTLTITVLDNTVITNPPVANTDFNTTNMNVPVTLNTLGNDQPGNPGGSLNPASVIITAAPTNGTATVDPGTGNITYTPVTGFTGHDTLTYSVCDNSLPTPLCATAIQIITVQGVCDCTINLVIAVDDYYVTPFNTSVNGNVVLNDSDPEGDALTVTPQNVVDPGVGVLVLNNDGTFTFTPETGFFGETEYIYSVCDNNATPTCTFATLHILVAPPVQNPNPDFNVTYVNVQVNGNVSTNDNVEPGSTYGSPTAVPGNPGVAVPVINSDGTYTFISDIPGVFLFDVPVCYPSSAPPCPPVLLTITVLDNTVNTNPPVANTDIATTTENTPVTLNTLANDEPGNPGGALTPSSVAVTASPSHGTTSVNPATGEITYTPDPGFTGADTLTYTVCDNTSPAPRCATAIQIITVVPTIHANVTAAADDYASTALETPVSGNAMINDTDPENDSQTITSQNTTIAGVGTLVLNSNGTWTFTPATGYTGAIDFPYTTCDNGTPQACTNATIHIIVRPTNTVPLSLLSFKAIFAGGSVKLVWDVVNESNVNRHYVERSTSSQANGFTTIGSVAARNAGTNDRYNFIDNLAGVSANVLYYRLRSKDEDAQERLSQVAIIRLGTNGHLIVSPNPVTTDVRLSFFTNEKVTGLISLYNAKGQLVLQQSFTTDNAGNQLIQLNNLGKLASGTYVLKVKAGAEEYHERLVIKH
ncbi:MAG: tandem-95 repeat protein [Bacteroidetes bacterium]|nr:tandem-95 repeat protein [Bacteroidota bacterium]